tara:strand:+ start:931 stop:1266 length:336 start_codon:yes stop_codon:yes gene_type:complete
MDDAVLGLVWVTSVCIVGHIATAWYFSRILKSEALIIDDKISEIDNGLGAMAQWMIDKFDSQVSQGGIDWSVIISQLFQSKISPNNDYSRALNGQFNGAQEEYEEIQTPQE